MNSIIEKLLYDTVYTIAYRQIERKEDSYLNEKVNYFSLYKVTGRYWYADPYVFAFGNNTYVFAEKMDRLKHRGSISVAMINGDTIGEFRDVIVENFHLSYPMVFEKNGRIFMIPESSEANSLLLYECVEFPNKWEKNRVLLNAVKYVDSNILKYKGHYYLICCEQSIKCGAETRLILYNADKIEEGIICKCGSTGEWGYNYRGAGPIFSLNSTLIRPAQCGNKDEYGKYLETSTVSVENEKLHFNKIGEIAPNRIKVDEKVLILGTHTYNVTSSMELIDVKLKVFGNPIIQLLKIVRYLKRHLFDLR